MAKFWATFLLLSHLKSLIYNSVAELKMMKRKLHLWAFLFFAIVIGVHANALTVEVGKEKRLSDCLNGQSGVTELVISGEMTAADFDFLKTLTSLVRIDMSKAVLHAELERKIPVKIFEENKVIEVIKLPRNTREIPSGSFAKMDNLQEIVLPDSVRNIEQSAFNECTKLAKINFPKTLEIIGSAAFYKCESLTTIHLSRKIKEIRNYAFNCCSNLTSVRIDGNIKRLGEHAFSQCPHLQEVLLNGVVALVGKLAFKDDTSLMLIRSANASPKAAEAQAFYGVPTSCIVQIPLLSTKRYKNLYGWKSLKLQETSLDELATVEETGHLEDACYADAMIGSLTISGNIDGDDLRYIKSKLKNLSTLNLSKATIVKGGMFDALTKEPWLKENAIPEGFMSSSKTLTSISFPKNLKEVGASAFSQCKHLQQLQLPKSVETIGEYAFNACSLIKQVKLPVELKRLEKGAFMYCDSLTTVAVGEKLEFLGEDAFGECKLLAKIAVNEGNSHYASIDNVLYTANATTLLIYPPARQATSFVTDYKTDSIAPFAFKDAAMLTEMVCTPSVRSIGTAAFANAAMLETVVLSDVQEMGGKVFSGMAKLKSVYVNSLAPSTVKDDLFAAGFLMTPTNKDQITLFVPKGMEKAYQESAIWKGVHINAIDVNVKKTIQISSAGSLRATLGSDAYYVQDATIEGTLNGDDLEAIATLPQLTRLDIGNAHITTGGMFKGKSWTQEHATPAMWLQNHTNIVAVVLPNSLKKLGEKTFSTCSALKNVVMGDMLTSIATGAFIDCIGLQEISIPNQVASLGWSVFSGCIQLQKLSIGAGLSKIGQFSFWNCKSLQEISVDDSNTSFTANGNVLFDKAQETLLLYATGMTAKSYDMPKSVTTIGREAFAGSEYLEHIGFSPALSHIEIGAMSRCTALKRVELPASVTTISSEAFKECTALEHVATGDMLTGIESLAFAGCNHLQEVTLGSTLGEIEEFTFSGCSALKMLTVKATTPPDAYNAFANEDNTPNVNYNRCVLRVPVAGVKAYEANETWGLFTHIEALVEDTSVVNFVTELVAGDRISMNVTSPSGKYQLDLGDGNLVEVPSGFYRGKVAGSYIKVYGDVTAVVASGCKIKSAKVNRDNLTLLNLNDNALVEFELPKSDLLTSLALQGNKLTRLVLPVELPKLKMLSLKGNQLTELPAVKMPELKTLMAGNNAFAKLDLTAYAKLQSIRLNNCKLTELFIPMSCTELHAENNQLTFAGQDFSGYNVLKTLRLSKNKIESFKVTSCGALKELELKQNGLKTLVLGELPALNYVDLRVNLLSSTMLDAVYEALPTVTRGTIKVVNNEEADKAHGYIATDKGWNIDVIGQPKEDTGVSQETFEDLLISYDPINKQIVTLKPHETTSLKLYAVSGELVQELNVNAVSNSVLHMSHGTFIVVATATNGRQQVLKIML